MAGKDTVAWPDPDETAFKATMCHFAVKKRPAFNDA
jgi:hypothetical protein